MAGIYIHIPFCKRKCVYCDFYSTALFERYGDAFIDKACTEIGEKRDFLATDQVDTLYFGGGTPSLLKPSDIGRLIGAVRDNYRSPDPSEITLEANPEDLGPQYLEAVKAAGVNRLSIGIQSLDDETLRFLRRRHNARRAADSVRQARQAGFGNISIDLIYGIPGMGGALWERTLRQALELRPEHISAYHLTFEPGTTLGKWQREGKVREVADSESVEQFRLLRRLLSAAGYEHYEVSNFALPGYRSRHNSAYWNGTPYLGIGPGAHSYNGATRRWCRMKIEDYVSALTVYESEELTRSDKYNETVMVRLRTADGLTLSDIAAADHRAHFTAAAEPFIRTGTLIKTGDRYCIPPEGFLTSDSVIAALFI